MCSSKTQGLISPRQDWSARLQEHFMNDKEQEFVRRFEFLFLSLEKWPSDNRKHKLCSATRTKKRDIQTILKVDGQLDQLIRCLFAETIEVCGIRKILPERPSNSTLEFLSRRVGIHKDEHIDNKSPDIEFKILVKKKKQTRSNSCILCT